MPRPFLLLLLYVTLFVSTDLLRSEELWSIGLENASHAEFSLSGNAHDYAQHFAKSTDSDSCFNIVSAKTPLELAGTFPWILPGTNDPWGDNARNVRIRFDFPKTIETDQELDVVELRIIGAGHYKGPPIIRVCLNGHKLAIKAEAGCKDDSILQDPSQGTYKTYRLLFRRQDLKRTGNLLELNSIQGSWFIFDAIQCRLIHGQVNEFSLNAKPISVPNIGRIISVFCYEGRIGKRLRCPTPIALYY